MSSCCLVVLLWCIVIACRLVIVFSFRVVVLCRVVFLCHFILSYVCLLLIDLGIMLIAVIFNVGCHILVTLIVVYQAILVVASHLASIRLFV